MKQQDGTVERRSQGRTPCSELLPDSTLQPAVSERQIILAPMEGVIDYRMRQMLTAIGGYDRCVTEFIRVSDRPVPCRVFRRICPELEHGGRTRSGIPVFLQLLGGDPVLLADSAAVAVQAGGLGVDLNFGCPAKTVNRHDGGSVLLREPGRIGEIVSAVRDRIDPAIPVCAKIRLGFDNTDLLEQIVEQISNAGATELCIHARTRLDGYKPPAYWQQLARLPRPKLMKLVVNGEIWNVQDAIAARRQSGCHHLMIGRGGLARPDLARILRRDLISPSATRYQSWRTLEWHEIAAMVAGFFDNRPFCQPRYAGNRTKQWLGYLRKQYPQANVMFEDIKRLRSPDQLSACLNDHANRQGCQQPGNASQNSVSCAAPTF